MRTIRYFVDKHAAEQPGKTFLVAPEHGLGLSYAGLQESCLKLADFYQSKGLVKGDKVSFMIGQQHSERQDNRGDHVRRPGGGPP